MQAAPVTTAGEESDLDIAQRIGRGDESAFELVMRRNNRMLYRTARAILKNDAEAEDALQEAYLLAYRKIATYRGQSRLSTWLARIVINEALMRVRGQGRERTVIPFVHEADDERQQPAEDAMKPEQPDQATLRAETRRLLEAKIDELPAAFRLVFMLRALEEMSVEETASALDIPEATVRTRFFRARGLLRESLAREIDVAIDGAFAFAGGRCDRIVAGVLARLRAGRLPDFNYSPAMRRSKIVWNEKTLDRFLANPLKAVPGTAMGYAGVKDTQERADLIAWLKEANASPAQCNK